MKITNKHNLPEAIYNAVKDVWPPKPNRFSVTDMTTPPLVRQLKIKHWDELEEDASDRLWMLLGNAVHYILEKGSPANSLSEEKMVIDYRGITLVGKSDLYHNTEVSDWKVTSVYSFLLGDKPEWEAALNIYKWMFTRLGFGVDKLTINAILRDHVKSKSLVDADYPPIPFMSVDVTIWPVEMVEAFISKAVADLREDIARPCSFEEQWGKPTTYAVMKDGRKTAIRVLPSAEEAEQYLIDKKLGNKHYIETRQGSKIRCELYCPVRDFCTQKRAEEGGDKS